MTMNEAHRSSGEGPARGEERPVTVLELRAADRPPEDPHLVAQHDVLVLELGDVPASGEDADDADEDEVGEGSQDARDATCHRHSGAEPVLVPHRLRAGVLRTTPQRFRTFAPRISTHQAGPRAGPARARRA